MMEKYNSTPHATYCVYSNSNRKTLAVIKSKHRSPPAIGSRPSQLTVMAPLHNTLNIRMSHRDC